MARRFTMADFDPHPLLTTDTVAVWDVACAGTSRHKSAEERVTATHLVFPYRPVYVQHVGRAEALAYIPLPGVTALVVEIGRWPVLFALVTIALAVLYKYGSSRTEPRWRWITWGSVSAAIVWLAASALFSWYVASFGSYNKTYGSLGAVIGFMTWIWISIIVALVGAKLNAEMEHQTVRDSTAGQPKPIGKRGARMADTVGEAQA